MILLSMRFRAHPSKRHEVLSAIDTVIERMQLSSGCTESRLFADTEDPDAFALRSEFESIDDADVFFTSEDFRVLRGLRMLLRDEPFVVVDEVRGRTTRLVHD